MTSKDAVELAYIEFQKYLDEDVNNQWLKNVIEGLKKAEKDLEILEEIKKNHPDLYNLYKKMKEAESEWLDNE